MMPNPRAQLVLDILDEMWNCDGWIDPLEPLLDGWTPEQAQKPFAPGVVSVEGNIIHTAFWEKYALYLLAGKPLEELGDLESCSNGKYSTAIARYPQGSHEFRKIRVELREVVSKLDEKRLTEVPQGDNRTREARANTRAVHSAYHAGQLSYLRRLFRAPEPKATSVEVRPAAPFAGAKQVLLDLTDFTWNSGYSFDPFAEHTADISKSDSSKNVKVGMPNILSIVNHMKFWEEYVTRRLLGNDTTDMTIVEPGDAPDGMLGWPEARDALINQHQEMLSALNALSDPDLAKPRPGKGKRFEIGQPAQWLVYGIAIHHAYHMGQIVLIRQLLGHKEHFA